MANDELTYNGGDRDSLIAIASRAVAFLCDKDPADVQVDDDGDLTLAGDSTGIVISFETDPSAIVFRATLLEGIKESPVLSLWPPSSQTCSRKLICMTIA